MTFRTFRLLCLWCAAIAPFFSPLFAAGAPDIDPDLLRALETPPPGTFPVAFPDAAMLPDYLRNKPLSLTKPEQDSLAMANEWASRYAKPVMLGSGKLVWTYGVSRPTIIGAPMQVCDIELQPGEQVNEIMLGDSARWALDLGSSGSRSGLVPHVLIKPMDTNLETTAVITTDRRVYHLRLVSSSGKHTPYVGFLYPEEQIRTDAPLSLGSVGSLGAASNPESGIFRPSSSSASSSALSQAGALADPSALSFAYEISGQVSWKPAQVYNDGQSTFIRLPENIADMPILLARNGREDVLVNYRVQGGTIMVDGVHDHYVLLLGSGRNQEKVDIVRQS